MGKKLIGRKVSCTLQFEAIDKVTELAAKENRTFSQMMATLVLEALSHREEKQDS